MDAVARSGESFHGSDYIWQTVPYEQLAHSQLPLLGRKHSLATPRSRTRTSSPKRTKSPGSRVA